MTRHSIVRVTLALAALSTVPAAATTQAFSFGSAPGARTDTSPVKPAADSGAKPASADTTPAPAFKPTWNFGVWICGTFTYQTDSATKAVNNGNPSSQFNVDRAYLTFRGQVAPDFGFRVTTDVKALPAVNAVYNGLIIRLKYAYMQWDYLHAAALPDLSAWARIGQIHTVMLEEEERF